MRKLEYELGRSIMMKMEVHGARVPAAKFSHLMDQLKLMKEEEAELNKIECDHMHKVVQLLEA